MDWKEDSTWKVKTQVQGLNIVRNNWLKLKDPIPTTKYELWRKEEERKEPTQNPRGQGIMDHLTPLVCLNTNIYMIRQDRQTMFHKDLAAYFH